MPFPGNVWAPNTWDVDAWAADTWADVVPFSYIALYPPDVVDAPIRMTMADAPGRTSVVTAPIRETVVDG